jgi:hypothetical protein
MMRHQRTQIAAIANFRARLCGDRSRKRHTPNHDTKRNFVE